ncbi:MAG: hypothetical protein AB7K24_14615 [Gemmataceae bacterium]
MKLVVTLLVVVSIGVGALGAADAYLVPIDLPDEELLGLTLNAPAGAKVEEGVLKPVARPGDTINPELLEQLRTSVVHAGHEHVTYYLRVKEFSFARWPGKWLFIIGCVGLLVSAMLMRHISRQELASRVEVHETETPEYSLKQMHEIVVELADAEAARIVDRLGEVQQTHVPAFIEGRARLIDRLGLAAYAELMDRFAAGERQINRAWSAAADGVLEEARACLNQAATLLEATRQLLQPAETSG